MRRNLDAFSEEEYTSIAKLVDEMRSEDAKTQGKELAKSFDSHPLRLRDG